MMSLNNKKINSGQAVPLALVLLAAVSAIVFYMFNTGQVVQEKMRLTNTADAVAYSAGVYEARVLNYDAYTNRAIIANQIAIGHGVGMGSWIKYTATLAQNIGDYAKYVPVYGTAIEQALDAYAQYATGFLSGYAQTAVLFNDAAIQGLVLSQTAVHANANGGGINAVINTVARRNDPDARADVLNNNFMAFTRFNQVGNSDGDDDRKRLRDTVERTRQQDDFLMSRDWNFTFGWCSSGVGLEVGFKNRGGTGLISYDGWKSIDTLSAHVEVGDDGECDGYEDALGYGSSFSADELEDDYAAYDRSEGTNPQATDEAFESDNGDELGGLAWENAPASITGGAIPAHWSLSAAALGQDDPRTQIAVRVRKAANRQRYSGGTSAVQPAGKLAEFQGQHHRGESVSIARAEVFFERPGDNNNQRELGSLFNPYWQVHLVPVTAADRAAALR